MCDIDPISADIRKYWYIKYWFSSGKAKFLVSFFVNNTKWLELFKVSKQLRLKIAQVEDGNPFSLWRHIKLKLCWPHGASGRCISFPRIVCKRSSPSAKMSRGALGSGGVIKLPKLINILLVYNSHALIIADVRIDGVGLCRWGEKIFIKNDGWDVTHGADNSRLNTPNLPLLPVLL